MEIHLPPDQEAHITALAAKTGRSAEELVSEAIELWEHENMQALARLRQSCDEAEAAIRRGEGIEITPETMHALAHDIGKRGRARLAAEQAAKAR